MSAARTLGFAALFACLGTVAGGALGLGLGLLWITVARTSSFEGYSGFVVGFWMLGGMLAGLVAGLIFGVRKGRLSPPG